MNAPNYASEAYKACLYGRADSNQQQSAASQIALLHGVKGELLAACQMVARVRGVEFDYDLDALDKAVDAARAAIAKATGATA